MDHKASLIKYRCVILMTRAIRSEIKRFRLPGSGSSTNNPQCSGLSESVVKLTGYTDIEMAKIVLRAPGCLKTRHARNRLMLCKGKPTITQKMLVKTSIKNFLLAFLSAHQ